MEYGSDDTGNIPVENIFGQPLKVYQEVALERTRADNKWGGEKNDDKHTTSEFAQWIQDYAGWARMMDSMKSPENARRRMVQIAGLAVAAIESIDRKEDKFQNDMILP